MTFLPITSNGERVYAGFWKRFRAACVDFFVFQPLFVLFAWLEGFDTTLPIITTIAYAILVNTYDVYFNAHFGGTLGKLAVGIRITKPDGMRIGWVEAWKRSSVAIVFALLYLIAEVWALLHVDPENYSSLGWIERSQLRLELYPTWFSSTQTLGAVWFWSEFVVLLFNKRRRAVHDFIAGTVVIRKEFADEAGAGLNASLQFFAARFLMGLGFRKARR